jgi:hypothetical protein
MIDQNRAPPPTMPLRWALLIIAGASAALWGGIVGLAVVALGAA